MPRDVQGVGIGLRLDYAEELLETSRRVDFLEVTPENWVRFGGKRRKLLDAAAERWSAVPHSVSLSIGGEDPLDEAFLEAVGGLCEQLRAPFWSDHLCYSAVNGGQLHDLLPLPFTGEAAEHTVRRVAQVKERIGVPFLLENATFYAHMPGAEMDEATFLCRILEDADCGLLLDVNNVYVNSQNHGFDPVAFIDRLPLERARQLHLAGHTVEDEAIIDTHIGPIIEPVWDLYRHTLRRAGRMIPTLIEWDQEIPELDLVLDEVDRARQHAARALEGASK